MNTSQTQLDVRPEPIVTSERLPHPDSPARFVVVIQAQADEGPLARRILEAAGREVLLLGAGLTFTQESEVRRMLALLAAFLRDAGTSVTVRMEPGPDWVQRLRADLAPDDRVSCILDESMASGAAPMHDILSRALDRPVYIFSGQGAWDHATQGIVRRLAPWLASVLVIVAFLGIQIALTRSGGSAGTNLLLLLTLPAEAGLLLLSNALLS